MTTTLELPIPSPLRECLLRCAYCVPECCGLGAFASDPPTLARWSRMAGPAGTLRAARQLDDLLVLVEDRSRVVWSGLLNHSTYDEGARRELLEFLRTMREAIRPLA